MLVLTGADYVRREYLLEWSTTLESSHRIAVVNGYLLAAVRGSKLGEHPLDRYSKSRHFGVEWSEPSNSSRL